VHDVRDRKILQKLANRFRVLRKERGITQVRLAEKSGISRSQIARIETAEINSTVCTLVVLAKALNVKPFELLRYVE